MFTCVCLNENHSIGKLFAFNGRSSNRYLLYNQVEFNGFFFTENVSYKFILGVQRIDADFLNTIPFLKE